RAATTRRTLRESPGATVVRAADTELADCAAQPAPDVPGGGPNSGGDLVLPALGREAVRRTVHVDRGDELPARVGHARRDRGDPDRKLVAGPRVAVAANVAQAHQQ